MGIDPISAIANTVGTIIDKIFPDANQAALAKLELEKMKISGDLQVVLNDFQVQLAQIEVNKEDAKGNWWQSGWRPAVGWIGAFSLGYVAIVEPMARFAATVWFNYTGIYPVIDTTITMQILFGILGLGAYRSFDKMKGTSK